MKDVLPLELGLCSWSLHQAEESGLRPAMDRLGLRVVHLALGPLASLPPSEQTHAIAAFGVSPLIISAGMIAYVGEDYSSLDTIRRTGGLVPDFAAETRIGHALACAHIAHLLGLQLVSTHVGFIPRREDDAAHFDKLIARIRRVADGFAELHLSLLFETGQETAADLAAFLTALERPNVGVNFDPANMLLYGKGDPVAAIGTLAKWIKHVHAKDTKLHVPSPTDPTKWKGCEIPLGQGDARLPEVIAALKQIGYTGPLVIECEAAGPREADIRAGIAVLRGVL